MARREERRPGGSGTVSASPPTTIGAPDGLSTAHGTTGWCHGSVRPSSFLFALTLGALFACDDAPTAGLAGVDGGAVDVGTPDADGFADAALDAGGPADLGTLAALTPEPGHRPGTRLQPQWVTGADGAARRFLQIWDSALGVPCWLTRFATDTTTVSCTPRPTGTIVYLDDTCTQRRVQSRHTSGWVNAGQVVRLGARVAQPALTYMEISPWQCVREGLPPDGAVYEIAETAAPGALATGRVVDDMSSDRQIRARSFVGDDGSRFLYDLVDTLAGVSCLPGRTESGARCIPDLGELTDEGLLDATCERLAILDYVRTAVAPIAARGGAIYRFEHPGWFGSQTFGRLDASGQCVAEERSIGRYTVHLGTPYPPREWPFIALESRGDDALRAEYGRRMSGERAEPESRVDPLRLFESHGEPCGLARDAEGTLRCVPPPAEGVREGAPVFADARCSERALAMSPGVAPPARVTLLDRSDGERAPLATVHAVGERLDAARVYTGACQAVGAVPRADYYRLGPALSLADRPVLRVVTEQ